MNVDRTKDFIRFIDKELLPAVAELENLADIHRKHVQKLVFTNLVDRFDFMVDKLALDNCREELFVDLALSTDDQPVTEKDLINLLLRGDDLESALNAKLKSKLQLSFVRKRHSHKLETILSLFDSVGEYRKKPRVNPSTGDIRDTFKIQNKHIPHSICGYADWLYARRNAIVHGAGKAKFLENDRVQIKKQFGNEISKTFKISIASIKNAANFYSSLCTMMK